MSGRVFGALGTMLGLVALYLVLSFSGGFAAIVKSISKGLVSVFATLQGRDVPRSALA